MGLRPSASRKAQYGGSDRATVRAPRNVGNPDALTVRGYRKVGGYAALDKALKMEPDVVIEEVKKSSSCSIPLELP